MRQFLLTAAAAAIIGAPAAFAQNARDTSEVGQPAIISQTGSAAPTTASQLGGAIGPGDAASAGMSASTSASGGVSTSAGAIGAPGSNTAAAESTTAETATSAGMSDASAASAQMGAPPSSYPPCRTRAQDRCRVMSRTR